MRNSLLLLLIFTLIAVSHVFAQGIEGGAPPGSGKISAIPAIWNSEKVPNLGFNQFKSEDFIYSTTTYTFSDLVIFSYFDSTQFVLINYLGARVDSVSLNADEYHVFSPGGGVYRIDSNNSFTILIGDPVTNNILGYFAVDESGRPLSTRLNTFMPSQYFTGAEHFIVFSYEDGTEVTIFNLATDAVIGSAILNKGEHLTSDNFSDTFLGVRSSKPVSALSYTDQGYFVPAANGTFTGKHFYGFSGYVGSWANGIVVTCYDDSSEYLIRNTMTGDTLALDMLYKGGVGSVTIYADTYFEVLTSGNCTVSNTPYAGWSGSYAYLTRQMDESGRGIGTNFYSPVIAGNLNFSSFADGNVITIMRLSDSMVVWSDTLDVGESGDYYTTKAVYHIQGTENLAVIHSFGGGFGADFVPLNFATSLADLSISADDITFDPPTDILILGDRFTITAAIHNYGFKDAANVTVEFFDGDPFGGQPISDVITIPLISAGGTEVVNFTWSFPDNPEYHAIYAVIDKLNNVIESNNSNNMTFKFVIPNDDLLPPFTTVIQSPSSISQIDNIPDISEFDVKVTIFNTGTVDATNTLMTIVIPQGLSLVAQKSDSVVVDLFEAGASFSHTWTVKIDSLYDFTEFFYSVTVEADTVAKKILERMIGIDREYAYTDIGNDGNLVVDDYNLKQNYPNPFNPTTTLEYSIAANGKVLLEIYDITGRKVDEIINQFQQAGKYSITYDATKLSSGTYFIRLNAGNVNFVRKMTLLK